MSNDNYHLKYTNVHIGKRITKLRKNKKMSMYQLSLASGISNSVLMRVEKGEREPRINTLLKIIGGLGISPKDFFNSLV
ncbi:helix-turn-helix domain-containing protein [Candidatus Margulisiibacteriota bacterium]